MNPYQRRYDYGLRGYEQTNIPRRREREGFSFDPRDPTFQGPYDERLYPRPNRVTARYNEDYVSGRRSGPPPVNPNRFGGDYPGRIVEEYAVGRPYLTHGGTRTRRGQWAPPLYDYPDYGPTYGGRYPDEF